ncbi:MAG: CoA transferase, partial [Jiangellaceae bacterium]
MPAPTVSAGRLAGVRVVSIAINLPGPVAAARFARPGTDVIKVEPPAGDTLAARAPDYYEELITGRRVERLDLKQPGQSATLGGILAEAADMTGAERAVSEG